jgi:Pyridoxamine 5'-phosphate oxidase
MTVQLSDEALALLGSAAVATVATLNPDGSPHLTSAWVGLENGEVVLGTLDDSASSGTCGATRGSP